VQAQRLGDLGREARVEQAAGGHVDRDRQVDAGRSPVDRDGQGQVEDPPGKRREQFGVLGRPRPPAIRELPPIRLVPRPVLDHRWNLCYLESRRRAK
jgi:hypothetical protein